MKALWAKNIFSWSFNSTPHPLGYYSCSGSSCVLQWVFSFCAMIAMLLLFIHVCSGISSSAAMRLHVFRLDRVCSTEHQQLQCSIAACAVLWKWMFSAQCTQGMMCSFWNSCFKVTVSARVQTCMVSMTFQKCVFSWLPISYHITMASFHCVNEGVFRTLSEFILFLHTVIRRDKPAAK